MQKYIENLKEEDKPLDTEAILSDDQLERGGLVKVEAFMRTRTSAAAARKAKQREREESVGLKQVNIKTDEETGKALKSIAAEVSQGKKLADAIIKTIPNVTSHVLVTKDINPETERLAKIGKKAETAKGWRKILIKLTGII